MTNSRKRHLTQVWSNTKLPKFLEKIENSFLKLNFFFDQNLQENLYLDDKIFFWMKFKNEFINNFKLRIVRHIS
ncbi:hypothetical protein BpHYR1_043563 [Brachionus plicatilis]|uniref:Uncharacterized protein n=1 Tax=Brachionus plicatilis TaxID=10195 RepID=A0A3M7P8W7_BRAPC|nr:hypothetical protein BpHYR1_043563 [Brachionus plicatilis]